MQGIKSVLMSTKRGISRGGVKPPTYLENLFNLLGFFEKNHTKNLDSPPPQKKNFWIRPYPQTTQNVFEFFSHVNRKHTTCLLKSSKL